MQSNLQPVGFLPLNICHVPEGSELAVSLEKITSLLLPMVIRIDMDLETLNKKSWTFPRINIYDALGLETGLLQVADDTCIILDETKLTNGNLEQRGKDDQFKELKL